MRKRRPLAERFWEKVKKTDGCWLWAGGTLKSGYGAISAGGRCSRSLRAHRVSYELFFGPIPEGLEVMHTCDTPLCVKPTHLFTGTHADNMADMARKKRSTLGDRNPSRLYPERVAKGEKNGHAKLTEEKICEIRAAVGRGEIQSVLAAQYGVCQANISMIANGKRWHHIHQEK